MKTKPLSAELEELEGRLRGRFDSNAASPELWSRVLNDVRAGLAGPLQSPPGRSETAWHWVAIAAAVLIVMNLSLIDGNRTVFSGATGINRAPVDVKPLLEGLAKTGAFK